MGHANPHAAMATQCIDAVRLAADPARLQQAPAAALLQAATVLARGMVSAIDGAGLEASRAAAVDLLDNAGRVIGAELRRRQ